MSRPILNYGNLKLLNVDGAKDIYDEVLVEDCYHKDTIPKDSIVFDIGGFCGEFGIWCALNRHCHSCIYEPSPLWVIAHANVLLNNAAASVMNYAVARSPEPREFFYPEERPAAATLSDSTVGCSSIAALDGVTLTVDCCTLKGQISSARIDHPKPCPICVKMDCEGAEREIFEDESWLPEVSWLAIEFHYKDGPFYHEVLTRHGFSVTTNDPNPEAWRATIHAVRK